MKGCKRKLLKKLNRLLQRAKVPRFLHHFGPKKFTSWQHLKCVFLKRKLRELSWRDLLELLPYFGITNVPHFTTLIKFAGRMPAYLWNLMLSWSAEVDSAEVGAIDATGLSRTQPSSYYVKRIDREPDWSYVKLSAYVDVKRRRFLSARLRAKPRHDVKDVAYLLKHSPVKAETNLLDKGYDANWVHALFREQGLFSIIPVRKGCTRGQYRKEMRDYFDHGQYWQRNIVESMFKSINSKFGNKLSSRKIASQRSECYARLILHNISRAIARLFHLTRFGYFPTVVVLGKLYLFAVIPPHHAL